MEIRWLCDRCKGCRDGFLSGIDLCECGSLSGKDPVPRLRGGGWIGKEARTACGRVMLMGLVGGLLIAGPHAMAGISAHDSPDTVNDRTLQVRHVFSGKILVLEYEFVAPFTGVLYAEAELFASSYRLAAPLDRKVTIEAEPVPDEQPRRHARLRFKVPDVEKAADLILVPRVRLNDSNEWSRLLPIRIRVHPGDLLDAVRVYSRDEPLVVGGDSTRLEALLKREDISFRTARRTPSGNYIDKGLILFEAPPRHDPAGLPVPSNEQLFLFFLDDFSGMPRTVLRPDGEGTVMEIKLPILERLEEDPLAQETFIEIIEMARGHLDRTDS